MPVGKEYKEHLVGIDHWLSGLSAVEYDLHQQPKHTKSTQFKKSR
jgi:hypothetical protein